MYDIMAVHFSRGSSFRHHRDSVTFHSFIARLTCLKHISDPKHNLKHNLKQVEHYKLQPSLTEGPVPVFRTLKILDALRWQRDVDITTHIQCCYMTPCLLYTQQMWRMRLIPKSWRKLETDFDQVAKSWSMVSNLLH